MAEWRGISAVMSPKREISTNDGESNRSIGRVRCKLQPRRNREKWKSHHDSNISLLRRSFTNGIILFTMMFVSGTLCFLGRNNAILMLCVMFGAKRNWISNKIENIFRLFFLRETKYELLTGTQRMFVCLFFNCSSYNDDVMEFHTSPLLKPSWGNKGFRVLSPQCW